MRQYSAVDFSIGKAVGSSLDDFERCNLSFLGDFVTPDRIETALSLAERDGVSADEALLAYGLMDETLFYQCLARHLGVPFASEPLLLDVGAAYAQAVEAGVAKIAHPDGVAFLSAPRGERLGALLRMKAMNGRSPAHLVITTPRLFAQSIRHSAQKRLAADASFALMSADMNFSARSRSNCFQMMLACGSFLLLSFGLYWVPVATGLSAALALAVLFFAAVLYRLFVAAAAIGAERKTYPPLADCDLPRYTIVVALHREARICRQLVERLERIDYPRSKLEIKFVIEDDDIETRLALKALKLPAIYEIIVAPSGQPRTKPRALNIALPFARGDYLCIYDAEDAPDRDQLRRAAAQFAASSDTISCLQAKLVVDNVDDTRLTRLFAIEYAALFSVQNVGLADCGHALPLGGSSNHFRLPALRHVMGWDAWNVTEDADLGFRLARFGYETSMLPGLFLYSALHSLAAWLAIYDLVHNPFHWHKTEHGLAKTSASGARMKAPSRHRLAVPGVRP